MPITLIQSGDVPGEAQVLSYKYLGDPFSVTMDGEFPPSFPGPLSYAPTTPKFASFNISKFRGRHLELKLMQVAKYPEVPGVHIASFLDSIVLRKASPTDFWFQRDIAGAPEDVVMGRAAGTNGAMVAVGTTILWSADGQRWVPQAIPTTNNLGGVAFGNGTWVAVGSRGTILTSPDGRYWTLRATDATSDMTNAPSFSTVTYAQGLFVAVGSQRPPTPCGGLLSTIWTSPDGITWTDRSPFVVPGLICAGGLADVIYTPEKQAFVAVPGATVSSDGVTWTSLQGGNPPQAGAIAFGNGQFMAAGGGAFTSTNALNWKQIEGLEAYGLDAVAYFDGAFWLAGATVLNGLTTGVILRSSDTKVWSPVDGLNLPAVSQILGLSVVGESLLATGRTDLGQRGLILQSASITAPPQFRAWETHFQTNGALALALDAPPGSIVSVDSSTDLKSWSLLQVVTNTTTRVNVTDPGAKGAGKRFYRAKTE